MKEQTAGSVNFDVLTLVRLLKGIDRLPDGATGALVFTSKDAPQGTVLVEDNRVCWAAASNMENRLPDILRHESDPPLPSETFDKIYEECYRDHIPLGETLVERGMVTPEGLWHGLLMHTAEAICALASGSSLSPVWATNRQRRYDAQYTFSTSEVLSCVGSFGFEEEATEAQQTLQEITPREAVGLAYLTDASHELPLAHVAAALLHDSDNPKGISKLRFGAKNAESMESVSYQHSCNNAATRRSTRSRSLSSFARNMTPSPDGIESSWPSRPGFHRAT